MLDPAFKTPDGKTGSLWDLRQWRLSRRTTADLDSSNYGTTLNDKMGAHVHDYRLTITPIDISGEMIFNWKQGDETPFQLHFHAQGWSLRHDGAVLAEGQESLVNSQVQLIHLDNRFEFLVNGQSLIDPVSTHGANAQDKATALYWSGNGQIVCDDIYLERDVHYSVMWALESQGSVDAQARLPYVRDGKKELLPPGSDIPFTGIGISPATALTIPDGMYLLLGDNSPHSLDSRAWGYVPRANIRGQVWFSVWFMGGQTKVIR